MPIQTYKVCHLTGVLRVGALVATPKTFQNCSDHNCGTQGVYFFAMPGMEKEDIKAAWKEAAQL